jgi:hypothetical protein
MLNFYPLGTDLAALLPQRVRRKLAHAFLTR